MRYSLQTETDIRHGRVKNCTPKGNEMNYNKPFDLTYYNTPAFRLRQDYIRTGKIKPRIYTITTKFSTFLQYCARDFHNAWTELGCETRFEIEDKDDCGPRMPEETIAGIAEFQPDVIFIVSHGRPTLRWLPERLPIISYVMDKCGGFLEPSLKQLVQPYDLFVCMAAHFSKWLQGKGIDMRQTSVMPCPADPKIFYPMPDVKKRPVIAFVKHGYFHVEQAFVEFLLDCTATEPDPNMRATITGLWCKLFAKVCIDKQRHSEQEMHDIIGDLLRPGIPDEARHEIQNIVTAFYITVYSPSWRDNYIQALIDADLPLELYGNGWENHARFAKYAKGPADRETDLNRIYNECAITVHIHHCMSMHQRIVECGLAGGFVIVVSHPDDYDWESIHTHLDYFAETGACSLARDCKHYLDAPTAIPYESDRLHEQCLKNHTTMVAAEQVMNQWIELLKGTNDENNNTDLQGQEG